MTSKSFTAATCALATLMAAPAAMAQQAAPPQITHAAPISGLCVFSIEDAVGGSAVGQAVSTRMQQLSAQANAELTAEKNAIDTEAKTLDGQRTTLTQPVFEQRATALQARANNLQRKAQLRDRELQATQQKAIGRIEVELDPLVRNAYQSKGCSILLQGQAVVGAFYNPAMDITVQVVNALNGKIQTLTFDRERLDPQTGAPAPSAAAPAGK